MPPSLLRPRRLAVASILLTSILVLLITLLPAGAERSENTLATVRRYQGVLSYPGPIRNPIGFHWNASANPDPNVIRANLPVLKAMRAGWVKLVVAEESGVSSARIFAENGIEPIIRLYAAGQHPDYRADPGVVRKYVAAGAHYFEMGNEPNSPDEWKGRVLPPNAAELLAEQWVANSRIIREAGGIPMFFAMMPGAGGKELVRSIFEIVRTRGQLGSFDGAAIAIHNRPFNHPLDYPDDALNRRSPRFTNVQDDDTTFRSYEVIDDLVFEFLGRSLPLIATEAGYAVGSYEDNRYPPVDIEMHRRGNLEIISGFRDGRWRDSLIAQCFWMLGSFGHPGWPADSWLNNPENGGRDLPAIDSLKQLPPFSRQFVVDKVSTTSLNVSIPAPYRFRQGTWEAIVTVSTTEPAAGSFVGVNVQLRENGRPVPGARVEMTSRYQNHEGFDRFPDTDVDGRSLRVVAIPVDERQGTWDFLITTPDNVRRGMSLGFRVAEQATVTPVSPATPGITPTGTPLATVTGTVTRTPTPVRSATPSPSPTGSTTATPSPTGSPSATPTSTGTATPTVTGTPTNSPTPHAPLPTATRTPTRLPSH